MIRRRTLFGVAALAGIAIAARPTRTAAAAALADPVALFANGDGGYANFRIPALLTTSSGTLVAFCEARWKVEPEVPRDSGDINIVARRSTDGGTSWSPIQVVLSQHYDTAGNPCVVVDPAGGLVLVSCFNRAADSYAQIVTGAAPARRVFVQRSLDDGATWTPAVEVTAQVRTNSWRWYATGPGVGAVLPSGRLVIPANHSRPPAGSDTGAEPKYCGAHLIYSDDHGVTWQIGASSSNPNGDINESEQAVVTLPDGTLYASVRCGEDMQPGNRADAYSDDGTAYVKMRAQCTLDTAVCQGSLLALPDGRLVYAGPGFGDARAAMTLWTSEDLGRTWWPAHKVSGLPAAYSSMTLVDADTIGLLYETGDWSPYRRIEFERIPIERLR